MTDTAQTPRVLLVEDDNAVAMMVEAYLKRANFDAVRAANYSGAVAILQAEGKSLAGVVTDFNYPGPSGDQGGVDTLQFVRANFPGLKVIGMSGEMSAMQAHAQALNLQFDAVLAKPFRMAAFNQTVTQTFSAPARPGTNTPNMPGGNDPNKPQP